MMVLKKTRDQQTQNSGWWLSLAIGSMWEIGKCNWGKKASVVLVIFYFLNWVLGSGLFTFLFVIYYYKIDPNKNQQNSLNIQGKNYILVISNISYSFDCWWGYYCTKFYLRTAEKQLCVGSQGASIITSLIPRQMKGPSLSPPDMSVLLIKNYL